MSVLLHPEAGPQPQIVRWRFSCNHTPHLGSHLVPSPLTRLGVTHLEVESNYLVVTLDDAARWPRVAGQVRAVLADFLDSSASQRDEDRGTRLGDDELLAIAHDVLAADIEGIARSHGGEVTLKTVRDGVVHVELAGACQGCPAASLTLHRRFEGALTARVGYPVTVEAEESSGHGWRFGRAISSLLG